MTTKKAKPRPSTVDQLRPSIEELYRAVRGLRNQIEMLDSNSRMNFPRVMLEFGEIKDFLKRLLNTPLPVEGLGQLERRIEELRVAVARSADETGFSAQQNERFEYILKVYGEAVQSVLRERWEWRQKVAPKVDT